MCCCTLFSRKGDLIYLVFLGAFPSGPGHTDGPDSSFSSVHLPTPPPPQHAVRVLPFHPAHMTSNLGRLSGLTHIQHQEHPIHNPGIDRLCLELAKTQQITRETQMTLDAPASHLQPPTSSVTKAALQVVAGG